MRTITLEVPDDLADRWETLPAEERNQYAAAANDAITAAWEDSDGELDPDLIEALQEGVADIRAGRVHPLEEVDTAIEAVFMAHRQSGPDLTTGTESTSGGTLVVPLPPPRVESAITAGEATTTNEAQPMTVVIPEKSRRSWW